MKKHRGGDEAVHEQWVLHDWSELGPPCSGWASLGQEGVL